MVTLTYKNVGTAGVFRLSQFTHLTGRRTNGQREGYFAHMAKTAVQRGTKRISFLITVFFGLVVCAAVHYETR